MRSVDGEKENSEKQVSVVIPTYNEKDFIEKCLESVMQNGYPQEYLEILVCDGMSTDGTRDIVNRMMKKYPKIRLIDNPKRFTPCGFNVGIRSSRSDVVIIMGAHANYCKDYIRKNVQRLYEYDADNVGGVLITKPRNSGLISKAIVSVLTSKFGVGNSKFRTGSDDPIEVDTVFGGCYKKSIFERIGLFNESLVCSQDIELNVRLKRAGGKILLFPDILVEYFARSRIGEFLKHNFRNGYWAVYPFKYVDYMPVKFRHLIPLFFVLGILASACLGLVFDSYILLALILVMYFMASIYFSIQQAIKEKRLINIFILPLLFFSLHFSYGCGSLFAAIKLIISKEFWDNWLRKYQKSEPRSVNV